MKSSLFLFLTMSLTISVVACEDDPVTHRAIGDDISILYEDVNVAADGGVGGDIVITVSDVNDVNVDSNIDSGTDLEDEPEEDIGLDVIEMDSPDSEDLVDTSNLDTEVTDASTQDVNVDDIESNDVAEEQVDPPDYCVGVTDDELGIIRDINGNRWAPADENQPGRNLLCPGWYVRSPDESTVWYIDENLERRMIPFDLALFTWIDDWDEVLWVTTATIFDVVISNNRSVKPGIILVKLDSDPSVYAVFDEDEDDLEPFEIRKLDSEMIAVMVYGFNWSDYVIDYPNQFWSDFYIGEPVTEPFAANVPNMRTREELVARRDGTW